jgi:hypothetical protein
LRPSFAPAAGRASDRAGLRSPLAGHPSPPRPPPSPLITECYPLVLGRARGRPTLDARRTAGRSAGGGGTIVDGRPSAPATPAAAAAGPWNRRATPGGIHRAAARPSSPSTPPAPAAGAGHSGPGVRAYPAAAPARPSASRLKPSSRAQRGPAAAERRRRNACPARGPRATRPCSEAGTVCAKSGA